MQFLPFPKLARLNRGIVITEKLDGTNAQVYIDNRAAVGLDADHLILATQSRTDSRADDLVMLAGSRTRWITPENDNMGFARWVKEHAEELFQLGPGQHFGEWWGGKIQRGYGLTEKRFSLFNTGRWADSRFNSGADDVPLPEGMSYVPACCSVVPVLYQGPFDQLAIVNALERLRSKGSVAAPGFMRPEGVVVFHTAANQMFKVTLEKDESPKSLAKVA
jgi:hypothetical protein